MTALEQTALRARLSSGASHTSIYRTVFRAVGLATPRVHYSRHSRLPLTSVACPGWIAKGAPVLLSDNVLLCARKQTSKAAV